MKQKTLQLRPSFTLETCYILEKLQKKTSKPLGIIIEELLNDSEKWKEYKKKTTLFQL